MRQITGLKWAKESKSPWPAVKRRPKGAKGLGLSYEKALAKALPHAQHGLWFEFEDKQGRGFCSPDFLFIGTDGVLVLEAKLTRYEEACKQLLGLYLPVLSMVYKRPVRGAAVVKYLSPSTPESLIYGSLSEILASPVSPVPILHWIGRGPVL